METLLDELCLIILSMLPTFEDRWRAGMANKQWKRAYRVLLKPYNDALASEHFDSPDMVLSIESCGPSLIEWNNQPRRLLPATGYHFDYHGHCVIQLFAFYSPHHICCYYKGSKRSFDIYRDGETSLWMLSYRKWNRTMTHIQLPNPCLNGDVFDQVSRAKDAFMLIWDENKTNDAVCFNPALARRIYNFPAFVKRRQELEQQGPPEPVDED